MNHLTVAADTVSARRTGQQGRLVGRGRLGGREGQRGRTNVALRMLLVAGLAAAVAAAMLGRSTSAWAAPPAELQLASIDLADHRGRVWSLADVMAAERTAADTIADADTIAGADGAANADEAAESSILVVAFLGTECPLAKLYAVRLGEIAQQYHRRGVRLVGVVSNRQDSLQKIAAFVDRHALSYPVLKDPGNRFADFLGAERTPEVFVFDQQRQLRYWGRIDDQYGLGFARDQANDQELIAALDDLLAGRPVAIAQTRSVGCIIGRAKPTQADAAVTYVNSVAAILQRRCLQCHRSGEIAPFAMEDPEEIAGWADMIAEVVREGRMPPWHASPEHGDFVNDRSLPDEEKQALYQWAEAGAPLGDLINDADQIPPPPQFTAGWRLPRQPDLIVPVSPQPFDVPATGAVQYQYFRVDLDTQEDRWLEAAELLPGNHAVVHHILALIRQRGSDGGIDAAREFLVGYVPGASPDWWPAGMAKRIPAGSELIFQVHYTPVGTAQQDQSLLGLCFTDPDLVTHEVRTSSALQPQFEIPPRARRHTVYAITPPHRDDAVLLGMSPHLHVRGKSFRYERISADGQRQILLDVPAYDFNWQTMYQLRQPVPLQAGDRIFCTAVYDNSVMNLNNPDPSATVRWGDQTWEEMMVGYYHYAVPRDPDLSGAQAAALVVQQQRQDWAILTADAERLRHFYQLDSDRDGRLTKDDVPQPWHELFDQLDLNQDGILTKEETVIGGQPAKD